jgi:ABC-type sugar transport system ATPase subunit
MLPVLELRKISKRFGAVEVLSEVSLQLFGGRVLALAGENGAGKSTLVKIIGGVHQPSSGSILKDCEPITLGSPLESRHNGIAVVHQHPCHGQRQARDRASPFKRRCDLQQECFLSARRSPQVIVWTKSDE